MNIFHFEPRTKFLSITAFVCICNTKRLKRLITELRFFIHKFAAKCYNTKAGFSISINCQYSFVLHVCCVPLMRFPPKRPLKLFPTLTAMECGDFDCHGMQYVAKVPVGTSTVAMMQSWMHFSIWKMFRNKNE